MLPQVPFLMSNKHLTILVLSHLKLELSQDLHSALLRHGMSRPVADIIMSLSIEEIQMLAELSTSHDVVRVANPTSPVYWTDLKRALANRDRAGVNLALIQGLIATAPSAAAAAAH